MTTIGTLLDPIADKLLISAALISLVQVRVLPGWMAILIIGREFAVSGLRSIAAAEGYTIKASDLGKTKMFSQVVAISCMLHCVRHPALHAPRQMLMWGVVFFALLSAVSYFRKFWHKVDERVKNRRRRELLTLERKRQRRGGVRDSHPKAVGRLGRRHDLEAARSELNGSHLSLGPIAPSGFPFSRMFTPPALPKRSVTCRWPPRSASGSAPGCRRRRYLPSVRASTQTGFGGSDLNAHGRIGAVRGADMADWEEPPPGAASGARSEARSALGGRAGDVMAGRLAAGAGACRSVGGGFRRAPEFPQEVAPLELRRSSVPVRRAWRRAEAACFAAETP